MILALYTNIVNKYLHISLVLKKYYLQDKEYTFVCLFLLLFSQFFIIINMRFYTLE